MRGCRGAGEGTLKLGASRRAPVRAASQLHCRPRWWEQHSLRGAERRAVLSSDLMQGLDLKLNVYWEDTGDTEPENQVSSPRKLLTREGDPSVNH